MILEARARVKRLTCFRYRTRRWLDERWNSSSVPEKRLEPASALIGRVGDELDHKRDAPQAGGKRASPVHPGGIDHVGSGGGPEQAECRGRLADQPRAVLPRRHQRKARIHGAGSAGRRDRSDAVAQVDEEAAEIGPVRSGTADLGRPDPGDDQDLHQGRKAVRFDSFPLMSSAITSTRVAAGERSAAGNDQRVCHS